MQQEQKLSRKRLSLRVSSEVYDWYVKQPIGMRTHAINALLELGLSISDDESETFKYELAKHGIDIEKLSLGLMTLQIAALKLESDIEILDGSISELRESTQATLKDLEDMNDRLDKITAVLVDRGYMEAPITQGAPNTSPVIQDSTTAEN